MGLFIVQGRFRRALIHASDKDLGLRSGAPLAGLLSASRKNKDISKVVALHLVPE